jgi:hypothetical protein
LRHFELPFANGVWCEKLTTERFSHRILEGGVQVKRFSSLSGALALLVSCGTDGELSVELLGPELAAWEAFRASATRVVDGRTIYVVEWDLPIASETDLWHYYNELHTGDPLIVNRFNNADDVWAFADAMSLTYCVSNTFGTNKNRAVSEMALATADWERRVNVSFSYDSSQDANCAGTNTNVRFAVAPWSSGGACSFFPSGDACVARTLVINFNDLDTNYQTIAPNMTTTGVFRHELGHILGLRHEHTRPEARTCFEDNNWRAITVYDQSSVMHYPWCNGVLTSDLSLTEFDQVGAIELYGLSASLVGTITLPLM